MESVIIAHALAAIFSFSDFGCACVGTYEKWVVLKTTRLSGVERIVRHIKISRYGHFVGLRRSSSLSYILR